MSWLKTLVLLVGIAVPVLAQSGAFGGFGGMSSTMLGGGHMGFTSDVVAIRPWVTATGSYVQNFTPASGGFQKNDSYGGGVGFGVAGGKRWEDTSMSLMYSGRGSYFEGAEGLSNWSNVLALGVTHRLGAQTSFMASAMAGYSSGGYGFGAGYGGIGMGTPWAMGSALGAGISGVAYGNPADNGLVDSEIYDVPVLFVGMNAGISHMLTARFGVQGGVGTFTSQRRYVGLFDNRGVSASGGMFYRLDERSSIGVNYGYTQFEHKDVFGGNRGQSVSVFYSRAITPRTMLLLSGAGYNFSSEFIGTVPVDPAIQDLFGTSSPFFEIQKVNRYSAGGEVGITHYMRTVHMGARFRRSMSPGNGVLLASWRDAASVDVGRPLGNRMSVGAAASYGRLTSLQQTGFRTEFYSASANTSFRLVRNMSLVVGGGYRRSVLSSGLTTEGWFANAGIAWAPGEIPIVF